MENTRKQTNRLLSILLCLCMVLSLIPATVSAAAQVSIPGSFNGWDTNAWIMTNTGNNIYTYQVDLEANTYKFKIMDNGAWLGNNGTINDHTSGYEWTFSNAGDCTLSASSGTYTFTYNSSTKGLKVERSTGHEHDYDVTFSWSDYNATCTATKVCDCGTKTTENCTVTKTLEGDKLTFSATCAGVSDSVTVDYYATEELYVDVSAMGWTNVNAYCWNNSGNMSSWPGTAMSKVSDGLFSISVPDGFNMIIFNNGSSQTVDLNMPTQGENFAVVKGERDVRWGYKAPPSYTLTFTDVPDFSQADWSYSITKPAGAPITAEDLAALEAAIPVVENYHITAWYLEDNSITEIPETMPDYDLTLYAYWEGVDSAVYFYSDPSLSEDSLISGCRFVYGETYVSLEQFIIANILNDYAPEGYHAAAVKYADGTDLEFPYVHGTEDLKLYVEYVPNACDPHTEETVPGYAATCTEPGMTDGVKCSVCGETLVAQEEIPVLPHTEETVAGYDATCTTSGLTDGVKCSACGATITAQEEIPAKGHSFEDEICGICGVQKYMTVYFQNNWFWSDVCLYYWGSDIEDCALWRGNAMDYYDNDGAYDYYVLKVPTDIDGMVISGIKDDGSGNSDQTPNIEGNWFDGVCYYMHWSDGNQVGAFDIRSISFSCKHVEVTVPGYDATCTEPGMTNGVVCCLCGATLTAQEEIPALGHSANGEICGICGAPLYMAIYFQNNWLWSDVCLYYWGSDIEDCAPWRGNAMTYVGYSDPYDYYVMHVPTDIDGMVISGIKDDGTGESDQTPNIEGDWYDGICYYMHWSDGNQAGAFDISSVQFGCKHVEETVPGYDATCTETGLTDGVICALCGEIIVKQEEIPMLEHEEPVYTNDGNDHDVDYPCCDDLDDIGLPHSFTDGKCLCGAPEFVQVTVENDYGTADTVTLSNTIATPGQDYVTTVTATVGTGIHIRTIYVAIEDCWYGGGILAFDTETNTLTVSGDYVAEGMKIEAIPIVTLTAHLNGGSVNGDYWEHTYKPDENGVINLIKEYGGAGKFFGAYATCFIREGYKLVGYNTAPDGTGTAYALDEVYQLAEDLEIWLIWECDHQWIEPTCTEPMTCDLCGATKGEALGHTDDDNSGRCDSCQILMQSALLCKVSASLKGNIALNYYMLLSDEVLADETAYMQFTMADGEIVKIPVAQGVKHEYEDETYYVFTCAVAAKEMTDTVLSQFFYEGGVTREHPYSVQTYAKHILANYDDAATKNLITAMLNYGAASQLHFGYNTDKLANAELEAPDYSNVTIDGFKAVSGQGTELAKLYSASLILKSETTVRIFFKVDSSAENLTVTYQGEALEIKQRSGLSYVDVVGISAKDLDENVTVTVSDGTNTADVSFNPMSYSQGVMSDTTGAFGQDMKDLVAALYLYNQAANVYFKEV